MTAKKRRKRSPAPRVQKARTESGRAGGTAAREGASIWDKPKIRAILREPVGAPIKLTRAEAKAIAQEGLGKRPDLPPGKEYVHHLRPFWKGLLKKRDGRRAL